MYFPFHFIATDLCESCSFLSWMLISLLPWVAFLLLIKVSDVATNILWDALFTTLQSFVTRLACQESSYHAVDIEVHLVVVAIFRSVFLISLWNSVEQLCAIFYNYYHKKNTKKALQLTAILRYVGLCFKASHKKNKTKQKNLGFFLNFLEEDKKQTVGWSQGTEYKHAWGGAVKKDWGVKKVPVPFLSVLINTFLKDEAKKKWITWAIIDGF